MHYGFKIIDDFTDGLSNWMDANGFASVASVDVNFATALHFWIEMLHKGAFDSYLAAAESLASELIEVMDLRLLDLRTIGGKPTGLTPMI